MELDDDLIVEQHEPDLNILVGQLMQQENIIQEMADLIMTLTDRFDCSQEVISYFYTDDDDI